MAISKCEECGLVYCMCPVPPVSEPEYDPQAKSVFWAVFGYSPIRARENEKTAVEGKAGGIVGGDSSGRVSERRTYRGECTWEKETQFDGYSHYATSCKNRWIFLSGTPEDNRVKFCPFCGGELIERTDGSPNI